MNNVLIRNYNVEDFHSILNIYEAEGWSTLVNREDELRMAFDQSTCVLVAVIGDEIVGFLRALSDGMVTTFICELIIAGHVRGAGIGKKLITYCHHLYPKTRTDLLASSTSHTYYESLNFRPFYGFRRTFEEMIV
jgi:ribosomal protein S18 acetylase RimI-like enzyme